MVRIFPSIMPSDILRQAEPWLTDDSVRRATDKIMPDWLRPYVVAQREADARAARELSDKLGIGLFGGGSVSYSAKRFG